MTKSTAFTPSFQLLLVMKHSERKFIILGQFIPEVPGLYSCSLKVFAGYNRDTHMEIYKDDHYGDHEIVCGIVARGTGYNTDSCSGVVRLSRGDYIYARSQGSGSIVVNGGYPRSSVFECHILLVHSQWKGL